ncbi:hypothetical protein HUW51_13380 [Adhaeribacter swui]|uniref:Uncharacterized protein n=1 Tax=Adhaeribacter swui TaxID=2086471 RepID=A0A7G7G930_9BACT|nr:DUF6756 family protein [Adhaeribacter swui]QNF33664.1 hypothetical protein HUW51_13380 [Adhaeribacter swui]
MNGFQDNLIKLANMLAIPVDEFAPIGIHEWPSIMKKIEATFIIKKNSNTKFNWWWEHLKGEPFGVNAGDTKPFEYLPQLIDEKEKIWFVACDSYRDFSKFWLFQGYIKSIKKILQNHYSFEYYLISKKYEWLLCVNNHDKLIGVGSIVAKIKEQKFE